MYLNLYSPPTDGSIQFQFLSMLSVQLVFDKQIFCGFHGCPFEQAVWLKKYMKTNLDPI